MAKKFKKFANILNSSFTLDKEKKQRLQQENKLNHAEKLALTPVSMILNPVIGIPVGIAMTAAGIITLPAGLLVRIFNREGTFLSLIGLGLVTTGVMATVASAISPVVILASVPYNGYKAFKHRDSKYRNDVHLHCPNDASFMPLENDTHVNYDSAPVYTKSIFYSNEISEQNDSNNSVNRALGL